MTNAIAKRQNGNSPVSFGNVFDNIFQNSFRRFFDDDFWNDGSSITAGRVPVNVKETNHHYEMEVIAPGCRKEDFNISIDKNRLMISFEQKKEIEERNNETGWIRNEYSQRSFDRSFIIDETVDVNNIKASYDNGILRLVLPKNEKAKNLNRKIEVN